MKFSPLVPLGAIKLGLAGCFTYFFVIGRPVNALELHQLTEEQRAWGDLVVDESIQDQVFLRGGEPRSAAMPLGIPQPRYRENLPRTTALPRNVTSHYRAAAGLKPLQRFSAGLIRFVCKAS